MDEIASPKWKAATFDAHGIGYPRTAKGNPSFKAGKLGWMGAHEHWLPQLIATANKYDAAGAKFLEGHILAHLVGDRIYAEINPHRSENGGTKSFRFSYSDPPLQQMPSRDEELGPLIRSAFLPEPGETWCTVDCSQQEFRLVAHHACVRNLAGASQAAERYRNDPDTDFHLLAAEITGLPRKDAKAVNFAKIYGAGVQKFAEMIGRPLTEAQTIYAKYDQQLPFLSQLSRACQSEANHLGYTLLYDGARRHWDRWATRSLRQRSGPVLARGGKAAPARSRPSLVWGLPSSRRHPHRPERADLGVGRAPHQTMDARVLARRHRPDAADARRSRVLGHGAGAGRADRPAGLRSGRAESPDARGHQVWRPLGRRPAQLAGAAARGGDRQRAGAHLPRGAARARAGTRGRPRLCALPTRPAGRQRGSQRLQRPMAAPTLPRRLHPHAHDGREHRLGGAAARDRARSSPAITFGGNPHADTGRARSRESRGPDQRSCGRQRLRSRPRSVPGRPASPQLRRQSARRRGPRSPARSPDAGSTRLWTVLPICGWTATTWQMGSAGSSNIIGTARIGSAG